MKSVTGREFSRLLEKKGWKLVRVKGSHHVYMKKENPVRISLPIHGNKTLKIGLMKHLMKLAEIDESEL